MSFVWSLKKLICERREEGGRDNRREFYTVD